LGILSFGKPFWQAILAGRVNTHCLPLFPMCLLVVALPANALKVCPHQPQRIVDSAERLYVIHVISRCIVAHLTHWTL